MPTAADIAVQKGQVETSLSRPSSSDLYFSRAARRIVFRACFFFRVRCAESIAFDSVQEHKATGDIFSDALTFVYFLLGGLFT